MNDSSKKKQKKKFKDARIEYINPVHGTDFDELITSGASFIGGVPEDFSTKIRNKILNDSLCHMIVAGYHYKYFCKIKKVGKHVHVAPTQEISIIVNKILAYIAVSKISTMQKFMSTHMVLPGLLGYYHYTTTIAGKEVSVNDTRTLIIALEQHITTLTKTETGVVTRTKRLRSWLPKFHVSSGNSKMDAFLLENIKRYSEYILVRHALEYPNDWSIESRKTSEKNHYIIGFGVDGQFFINTNVMLTAPSLIHKTDCVPAEQLDAVMIDDNASLETGSGRLRIKPMNDDGFYYALQKDSEASPFTIYGIPEEGMTSYETCTVSIDSIVKDIAAANCINLLFPEMLPVLGEMIDGRWLIYDESLMPPESIFIRAVIDPHTTLDWFAEYTDWADTMLECIDSDKRGICEAFIEKNIYGCARVVAIAMCMLNSYLPHHPSKKKLEGLAKTIVEYENKVRTCKSLDIQKRARRMLATIMRSVGMYRVLYNPENTTLPHSIIIEIDPHLPIGIVFTDPRTENVKKAKTLFGELKTLLRGE